MRKSTIPEVSLGWRLKMSLASAGMHAFEMAERLEVSRATVSRWMADRGAPPHRIFIRQWAQLTGVDQGWLLTGAGNHNHQPAA
jgi:transcriptional regulator with XRE-family HTH domain